MAVASGVGTEFLLVVDQVSALGTRYEHDLVDRVGQRQRWRVVGRQQFQESLRTEHPRAVVVFRRFRTMESEAPIDWHGFDGLRTMLDFDAFHDFTTWGGSAGRWTRFIRSCGFDLLACSGLASVEHFEGTGIATLLVHKGYEPDRFFDIEKSGSVVVSVGCWVGYPRVHPVSFLRFRTSDLVA